MSKNDIVEEVRWFVWAVMPGIFLMSPFSLVIGFIVIATFNIWVALIYPPIYIYIVVSLIIWSEK